MREKLTFQITLDIRFRLFESAVSDVVQRIKCANESPRTVEIGVRSSCALGHGANLKFFERNQCFERNQTFEKNQTLIKSKFCKESLFLKRINVSLKTIKVSFVKIKFH